MASWLFDEGRMPEDECASSSIIHPSSVKMEQAQLFTILAWWYGTEQVVWTQAPLFDRMHIPVQLCWSSECQPMDHSLFTVCLPRINSRSHCIGRSTQASAQRFWRGGWWAARACPLRARWPRRLAPRAAL